jgi:very-short-patch-repair endonuclease
MSPAVLILVLLGVASFLVLARRGFFTKGRGGQRESWPVFPKRVLTPIEQTLYHRLVRAFPEHVVLSQVALSQLVGVKKGENFKAVWNRYNRLVADFVVCTRDFSIAAVLELDDRSHDSPQRQDADRRKTAVLAAAGIPLHRLNVNPLPNETALRALLKLPTTPDTGTTARIFSLRDRTG